ncbi:dityrosine synthesis enzyme [Sticta canariensis]|nr:dityrosine synthesis enzyme [Sticta canariensis]
MEFANQGSSIYHQIHAVYARSLDGTLLYISGRHGKETEEAWPAIMAEVEGQRNMPLHGHLDRQERALAVANMWEPLPKLSSIAKSWSNGKRIGTIRPLEKESPVHNNLGIRELQRPSEQQIVGILMDAPEDSEVKAEFQDWFVFLLLHETRLNSADISATVGRSEKLAREVTHIFEDKLRNIATDDQWESGGGRVLFEQQAQHFIARNRTIEFCLPAFPCKSSNLQKVTGIDPDRSEESALWRLDSFVKHIEQIYEPGAKVLVVSDGHVFSDCIGVEDDIVDRYSEALAEINQSIIEQQNGVKRVEFYSLHDLFFSNKEICNRFKPGFVEDVIIHHPLDRPVADGAEICRKVLIAGCRIERAALRSQIDKKDASILALYRGFARFMLEDLSSHERTSGLTKSKAKKLSSNVAFEMISRNQAYSNMIELLFPCHIRISIHAHKNNGPKFGIQLLSNKECRSVESLEGISQRNLTDLLHIPTPWHNTACQIQNDPTLYIIKSNIVREALRSKRYEGEWIPAVKGHGGFFSLRTVNELGPQAGQIHRLIQEESQPAWKEEPIAADDADSKLASRDPKQEVQRGEGYLLYIYTCFQKFVGSFWTGAQLQCEQARALFH